MRITRLEAENFMKLEAIDIKFDERVTEFAGRNGSGKTTLFLAIKCTLEGKDALPDDPIRHGADRSFIRTHLAGDGPDGGLLVTCRLRKSDDGEVIRDLVLETPEGARFPSPQTHLKKLISEHLLDPLHFIEEMDAKQQYDTLRSFVPDFDFAKNEQMRKGAFEQRTDIGRDLDREQKAADAIDVLDKAPGERVDEAALTADLEAAGTKNLDIERRRTNRESATARVSKLRSDAEQRAAQSTRQVLDLNRQIEELKAKIADEEYAARNECKALTDEADELQRKLDAAEPLPQEIDAATITAKLTEARRVNRLIEDWETQRARKVAHQREAARLSREYDALTSRIVEYDQAKKDAIQKATLPIDGLGFGDGFITLNGVPFKQASKGEQMRTAFALCVAKRPHLPFCWIRDASLLDEDSLKLVYQLAEQYDAQLLLEFVRPNSSNAIVIEEGRVAGVELPPSKIAPPKAEAPADSFALSSDQPSGGARKRSPRKWRGPGEPKGDVA